MLNRALREPGLFRQVLMTESHSLFSLTNRATPQVKINHKSSWAMIVTHEVTKQYIDHVFVEAEGCHIAIVVKTIAVFKRLY